MSIGSLKTRVFNITASSAPGGLWSYWFDRFMIVLILTNVAAVILETVEELEIGRAHV